jgi:hypothetical protein
MRPAVVVSWAAILLVLLCLPSESRVVRYWTPSELTEEADLVILGKPTKTTQTKERYPEKHGWPFEVVGVETKVTVLAVLKGKAKEKAITLLHYAEGPIRKEFEDKGPTPVIDGPDFLSFRTKSLTRKTKGGDLTVPAPDYLMFLRCRKDGRYEPLSGPFDPRQSVREVYARPIEEALPPSDK